mmetsp:Transcript_152139/g.283463  ORF Transcript_152139/g.283463 Transcript_152139/m.283463 type:complete len:211 (-) Transcript_152139:88-720(-)
MPSILACLLVFVLACMVQPPLAVRTADVNHEAVSADVSTAPQVVSMGRDAPGCETASEVKLVHEAESHNHTDSVHDLRLHHMSAQVRSLLEQAMKLEIPIGAAPHSAVSWWWFVGAAWSFFCIAWCVYGAISTMQPASDPSSESKGVEPQAEGEASQPGGRVPKRFKTMPAKSLTYNWEPVLSSTSSSDNDEKEEKKEKPPKMTHQQTVG